MKMRMESDSIGDIKIPEDAYYGIQSFRASNNFKITKKNIHSELIVSLAEVKNAAKKSSCHFARQEDLLYCS